MVDNEVILEIRSNLKQYGGYDLLGISADQEEGFWNWFKDNANVVLNSEHQPPEANNKKMYHQGRCFGNAQSYGLEFGISYFEGFVKVEGSRYIHHGFNVTNGLVSDPSAVTSPEGFIDHKGELPIEYYGIEIPLAWYEDQEEIINNSYAQTSFLGSYSRS